MSKLKDWLSANEIYFRTLPAIMFGASALFVSLASYIVSSQQLRLSEVASEPHFYALHKYKRNETSGFFDNIELTVQNAGGPVYNVRVHVRTFAELDGLDVPGGRTIHLPIKGYYWAQFPSGAPTGEVARLTGEGNNKMFNILYLAALDRSKRGELSVFIRMRDAIRITYETRYGRSGADFFIGTERVSQQDYETIARYEVDPVYYELAQNDFDIFLKKAKEHAYFVSNCTLRKNGPNSYSHVCPASK